MTIEVYLTEYLTWTSRVRNKSRLTPEELCAIAVEAAELFEKEYGIQQAYCHEVLNALVEALAKTLEIIKITPLERIDGTLSAWKNRSPKVSEKIKIERPVRLARGTLDHMTYGVGALFTKRGIEGFKSPGTVLSTLEYHLAGVYIDFLGGEIGGMKGKAFATSMEMPLQLLERIRPLESIKRDDNFRWRPSS
ncbi:MAG: hypothetical protein Q8Q36_01290 [bacterium]|nr:hypothetical protein [bacterium]